MLNAKSGLFVVIGLFLRQLLPELSSCQPISCCTRSEAASTGWTRGRVHSEQQNIACPCSTLAH
jgi:hypothetical protein